MSYDTEHFSSDPGVDTRNAYIKHLESRLEAAERELAEVKARNVTAGERIAKLDCALLDMRRELAGARAHIAALFIECDWPEGGDIDGFAFQDIAEKYGALTPEQRVAPCGDACACMDYGNGPGEVTCYRMSPWLVAARAAQTEGGKG